MATYFSWTGYFLVMGATVAIYYVIIGVRYYQHDIKALIKSRSQISKRPEKPPPVEQEFVVNHSVAAEILQQENVDESTIVHDCRPETIAAHTQAAEVANMDIPEHVDPQKAGIFWSVKVA
jgi:hypothetical protein